MSRIQQPWVSSLPGVSRLRRQVGNCTLRHSEHTGMGWMWLGDSKRVNWSIFRGQCDAQPEKDHGSVQLPRSEPIILKSQMLGGKRWQSTVGYHIHSPRAQTPFSFLLVSKRSHRASSLESKGLILCLLHPLNTTDEAPKAQRTKGRTPRHMHRHLESQHPGYPCYKADPPDLVSWSSLISLEWNWFLKIEF